MNSIDLARGAAALAVVVLAAACGGPSADRSLAAAKGHLARNDLDKAVIELKNALQAKPNSEEARFVLGTVLLEADDPVLAAVELRKADELGYSADQTLPLLARAYVLAGEPRKALGLDGGQALKGAQAIAALKTQIAAAHAALGDPERAETALTEALSAAPTYAPAQLLRARSLASKGNLDAATQVVESVLSRLPSDAEALMLRAELHLTQRNTVAALDGFRQVLIVRPKHLPAHAALLDHFLSTADYPAAQAQLAAMKKSLPRYPQTSYFEARLAAQTGDLRAADELVKPLLKGSPENPRVLQLAGSIALKRGELEQAEQHFGKLLQVAPGSSGARQMLARVAMAKGDAGKALSALQPLLDSAGPDAETFSLAGAARMQLGEVAAAEDLFRRAVKQRPDDPEGRTRLALARLAKGDGSALAQLDAIAGADTGDSADIALIAANTSRRDFDAALKAAERLVAKQPGKAGPLHLRGQVLALRGDLGAARSSFDAALAADPKYSSSIDALVKLDLREGKPGAARARLTALVKSDPRNARALLALAMLDERQGKPVNEVAAAIAKAVAADPTDPGVRNRLVEYLLEKREYQSALTAAQEASAALPNDATLMGTLARAQLAAGDSQQAAGTYSKLAARTPTSVEPLLGAAGVRLAAGDMAGALGLLKKALALSPDHPLANRWAVNVMLELKKPTEAAALARALANRRADLGLGDELLGTVERHNGRLKEAIAAFQAALRKDASSVVAQTLHATLLDAGQAAQARAFSESWLDKQPRDLAFLMHLALAAGRAGDHGAAVEMNRRALAIEPDSPRVLNNLAWTMHQHRQPGALKHAARANQLQPDTPDFMDTLAVLMADAGQVSKALALQQRAVTRAPESPALRLTLAKLYLKAGKKPEAREELERLRALGARFDGQDEVAKLLAGG